MSDESELNRLRADLEKFASLSLRYRADVQIRDHQNYLRNKIAELEAAADPWREAREAVPLHMKIAGLQDEVARLTARVGELEDVKPVADMQPPFEGPVVGFDPVLDPARVLATAVNVLGSLYKKKQSHEVWAILQNLDQDAKPYPLKKGGE